MSFYWHLYCFIVKCKLFLIVVRLLNISLELFSLVDGGSKFIHFIHLDYVVVFQLLSFKIN